VLLNKEADRTLLHSTCNLYCKGWNLALLSGKCCLPKCTNYR